MAIYCDAVPYQNADHAGVHRVFRGRPSLHLMADSDEELIAYAESIGMRRAWIQHPGEWSCHFDVTGARLDRVMRDPRVVKLDRNALVERWRSRRRAAALAGRTDARLTRDDLLDLLFAELDEAAQRLGDGGLAEMKIRLEVTATEVLREIHSTGAIRDTIAGFGLDVTDERGTECRP
jgi:hypothetical protein